MIPPYSPEQESEWAADKKRHYEAWRERNIRRHVNALMTIRTRDDRRAYLERLEADLRKAGAKLLADIKTAFTEEWRSKHHGNTRYPNQ